MKKKALYIAIAVAAVTAVVFLLFFRRDPMLARFAELKKNPVKVRALDEEAIRRMGLNTVLGTDDDKLGYEERIAFLRARYGKKINRYAAQINLLDALWRHCKKANPDGWIECVQEYLQAAFPELAGRIFQLFEDYYRYQTWLSDNQSGLQGLSNQERKRLLWQKRYDLFGKEVAEEIWAMEIKNDQILEQLEKIDRMSGSLNEKLVTYKGTVDAVYGEEDKSYVNRHQQDLMDRFLNLESVQEDLERMQPEERKSSLREVRKAMGLNDEALRRWDELDAERDKRWTSGTQYTREREELAAKHSGSELESKLAPLRQKHFGAEADSVKAEEESGYFRFKEKRKWGQN